MVYIILVNWNGWKDTIECLESVLRLKHQDFRIIVSDNASTDGSVERIGEWAEGKLGAECSNPALEHLIRPAVEKPVPVLHLAFPDAEEFSKHRHQVTLVETGANLGFAGASNVGLRLALAAGDLDYAWLLNNDTIVEPDALTHLVNTMQGCQKAGMCGSTLLYYSRPRTVQALGGSRYNPWTARMGHIGRGLDASNLPPAVQVEKELRYIVGASMLVSRAFLKHVALLSEDYFLYYEELDWATRGKEKFSLAYAPQSVVYHKEGSSTGSCELKSRRSSLTEYYGTRNRLLFTREHYPAAMPLVCICVMMSALHRLFCSDFVNFQSLVKGFYSGLISKSAKSGMLNAH